MLQSRTVDVVVSLPLECRHWTTFHLESRALLSLVSRAKRTLYIAHFAGRVTQNEKKGPTGREEVADVIRSWLSKDPRPAQAHSLNPKP